MIINLQDFKRIKRKITKDKKFLYKLKQQKKENKLIKDYNKNNDKTFYFNVDYVYELENLHKRINWFKYYLELYLNDLFIKYENIQNNKINLK